ncbi:hypothetical protein O181_049983 [Austropuccinia psidii MF-1]|uniref:Uncharacterized protein n=1 Tax=Austropuccinia psidii MF-1 TaxID=1389203 RepID=A0A9Q3E0X1_9BASI|nr:hypothetical protein [Austropuccinia psidii MF-1]
MSCKGQVQEMKALFKNQSMFSEDQKKKLAQGEENSPVEAPQASTSKILPPQVPKSPSKSQRPTGRESKRQRERESPSGTSVTSRITGFPRKRRQPWTMC